MVAAFSEAQKAAIRTGFPDNLTTYALVSSIWTSTFALGAFVGPTAAGSLYDAVGFRWSTLFTVSWNVLVGVSALMLILFNRRTQRMRSGYQEIGGDDEDGDKDDVVKESDRLIGEVQTRLYPSDENYQTL